MLPFARPIASLSDSGSCWPCSGSVCEKARALIADGGKGTKRDLWISMIITTVANLFENVRAQYINVRYRFNTTAIMFVKSQLDLRTFGTNFLVDTSLFPARWQARRKVLPNPDATSLHLNTIICFLSSVCPSRLHSPICFHRNGEGALSGCLSFCLTGARCQCGVSMLVLEPKTPPDQASRRTSARTSEL